MREKRQDKTQEAKEVPKFKFQVLDAVMVGGKVKPLTAALACVPVGGDVVSSGATISQ